MQRWDLMLNDFSYDHRFQLVEMGFELRASDSEWQNYRTCY